MLILPEKKKKRNRPSKLAVLELKLMNYVSDYLICLCFPFNFATKIFTYFRGTLTVERWAHTKVMKFNNAKCKVLHLGQGNSKYTTGFCLCTNTGWTMSGWIDSSSAEKDLGPKKNEQEPSIYTCSQESQSYPGLHCQQVEGVYLLCSHDTPPGVLSFFFFFPPENGTHCLIQLIFRAG